MPEKFIFDSTSSNCKKGVRDFRNDQPNFPGTVSRQTARHRIRSIVQGFNGIQHFLPRLVADKRVFH